MLTITSDLARDVVAPYCRRVAKPYSEAFYLYCARNRGELLAAALFEVGADAVTVLLYEAADGGDEYLLDGVLRAGLNYAAEQGIATGVIPDELRLQFSGLFAKLNYPAQPRFDITNFFQKYKNCPGV